MSVRFLILVICLLLLVKTNSVSCKAKIRNFPPGFLFGAATSAFQNEGAWNTDGKGPSVWDIMTHLDPSRIKDGSTADIATDSYRLYQTDINMTSELGLDFFRFSISWPRILPTGFPNKINEAGVEHYNKLIDGLLKKNVTPFVTMFHWDLPVNLQKMGGWTNPDSKIWFLDYVKILFDKFGDRVKYWLTINEPSLICYAGYGTIGLAPMLNISGIADYLCVKNVLLSHAAAYHLYDDHYRKTQNGKIGFSMCCTWFEPLTNSPEDQAAAEEAKMFEFGIFAHPVFFPGGDFPQEVKRIVALKSAKQGWPRSRLPELSAEEVSYISNTSDFFGLNHYSTSLATNNQSIKGTYELVPSYKDTDFDVVLMNDPSWTKSYQKWLKDVPWGFYKLLRNIKDMYNSPTIYVLENGWATAGGLKDDDRISYMRGYLNALLDAVDDGVDVKSYCVWSFMDNFEWNEGYTKKFGIYEVDFSSTERKRTPRKSAYVYKEIIRSRRLNPFFEPSEFTTEAPKKNKGSAIDFGRMVFYVSSAILIFGFRNFF